MAFSTALSGGAAPGEGGMAGLQNGGHRGGVEVVVAEMLDDGRTGQRFVVGRHFLRGQGTADGHRTEKMIGVRGAEAGEFASGLGEGGRLDAVGVANARARRGLPQAR